MVSGGILSDNVSFVNTLFQDTKCPGGKEMNESISKVLVEIFMTDQ